MITPLMASASNNISKPLMVNDKWGYYPVTIDSDNCTIYEARTVSGEIIMYKPLYRISNFIFTQTKGNNCK